MVKGARTPPIKDAQLPHLHVGVARVRTAHSRSDLPYPGCTGILDNAGAIELDAGEIDQLRDNVESIVSASLDPDEFLSELVRAANRTRHTRILDEERKPAVRRKNILSAMQGREQLSPINRYALAHLAAVDKRPESELLPALLSTLRSWRGRPPEDHLLYMAIVVRQAFEQFMPVPPSSWQGGEFVALLEAVATAADHKPREGMHSLAEETLRIEIVSDSPGVSYFALPRFS